MGRVDPIGVGYIEFEVAGGCDSVRHRGGDWLGPKIRKPSRRGLGLASEMRVGWFLGIEDPIVVKYIGFEEGGLRFGEASFVLIPTHLLTPVCPAHLFVRLCSSTLISARFCSLVCAGPRYMVFPASHLCLYQVNS